MGTKRIPADPIAYRRNLFYDRSIKKRCSPAFRRLQERGERIPVWLIILGAVLAAALAGAVYLTACIGHFRFVRKLSGGKKWRNRGISFLILAAVFAALSAWLSFFNAVIVFLHAAVFFLLTGLVFRVFPHLRGREFRVNWQGLLALGLTVGYLAAGYILCHHVWRKDYRLRTDKEVGTLTIALIADSHLGTTFGGEGFARHLTTIAAQSPDLLMIAGDFVDDSTKREDMFRACEALGEADFPLGVWYVYGNHDEGYFRGREFTAEELKKALMHNGVHVLEDAYEEADGRLIVAGRRDASSRGRMDMETLLTGADPDRYIVVLDHQPSDYENEAASPADLVLSGHTHGGQLIPITYVGKWLGMLDSVYGHENRQGTDFIVTSGISDWELLFKTGTRSEYVIITVEGK